MTKALFIRARTGPAVFVCSFNLEHEPCPSWLKEVREYYAANGVKTLTRTTKTPCSARKGRR